MKLITKINDITFSRSVEFQVSYENLSPVITNIDDAIKKMKYLIMTSFITRKEYKEINNAIDDKKRELYLQFWKSVDPTPRTKENEIMNEYYQRINLANQLFASHNNGWKTDRGMVLTIFGHPDDVENHSFEMDRKPYIIWYYHRINRSFVFVDYTGFGSYQLSQPLFDFSY
jgi:GWxTD domain-containing protein